MNNKPPIDLTVILEQQAWDAQLYGIREKRPAFARGLNRYKLVWVFLLAGVGGTLFESLLRLFATGDWMRTSGVVLGPFNQIYGLGAVLMLLALYPLRRKNALWLLAGGTLLGLAVEFASSWVQEKWFRSASWDYSGQPFNIAGRTNLLYGIGWGLLAFLFVRHLWPCISHLVEKLPPRFGKALTLAVALWLCFDMAFSAMAVHRWERRDAGVPASTMANAWFDAHYPDRVMRQKYPGLEFKE